MAKTKKRARKRATADRDGSRARKSGVSKARKPGLRKPKPARTDPRKRKPSLQPEIALLERQLKAARIQQEASAEILRAVANASGDAAGPLQFIAETTARLFKASSVAIQLAEGSEFTQEYRVGAIAKRVGSAYPRSNIKVGGRNLPGTVVAENRQIHIPDLDQLDPSMSDFPGLPHARAGGARTVCGTPLRRAQKAVGALIVLRDRLSPFTGDELALLQSFADQAAIAIENARLFNDVEARTRDLTEALLRQTATADVLKIVSRSVSHAAPVFETIIESCQRLFDPYDAAVYIVDGEMVKGVARRGPGSGDWGTDAMPLAGSSTGLAIAQRRPLHFPDLADKADLPEDKRDAVRLAGGMSVLYAPIISESRGVGSLVVTRRPRKPFTETEIEFIQSFADQAAIAIENARLFNEVGAKTRDLSEALEQQTATSAVLAVISRSPSDLNPVLEAISDTAARLCGSEQTMFFRYDGKVFRILASWNFPPEVHEMLERRPLVPGHPSAIGRAGASLKPVCIPDVLADPAYGLTGEQSRARYRATLAVPLLREGQLVGALSLNRSEPGAFTEKQIELVATFADQAVIAIENTRLFNETREALAYQTGSSNVLRVIASSPTDVEPVLTAIVESARELCEANDAVVLLKDAEHLRFSAHSGPIPVTLDKWPISRDWTAGRAFVDQKPVHVHDMLSGEGAEFPDARAMGQSTGAIIHTVLSVPLLRGNESIGAILLRRTEVRPFNDKQIKLLSTFADQAVIAIQNAKLFHDTQEALERQTATSEILRVISQSPTEVQPVFDAIVETAVRLIRCDVAFVLRCDGTTFSPAAAAGPEGPLLDLGPSHLPIDPAANFPSRAIVGKKNVHLPDWSSIDLPEHERRMRALIGVNSALFLPLLRDTECIGVLALAGKRANIFGESEIALAESFRDQAVIAIENVRLFNETREALERQTATAEILKVIASSPDDVQPVFQAIAERSNHLVGGFATTVVSIVDDVVHLSAFTSTTPAADAALIAFYPRPLSGFSYSDAIRRGEIHRIVDAEVELAGESDQLAMVRQRGWRSALWVPLLLEGEAIGVIGVTRVEPGPFADHHVDMLKTFADQAVIAISNVKLFKQVQERTRDLEESLQQQTATSEVLQVISRSVFDLKTVLRTLLESAAGLCDASICILFQSQGDLLHVGASYGGTPEFVEYLSNHPHRFDRATVAGRAAVERRTIHISDIAADAEYGLPQSIQLGGWQSIIGVPLLRDGEVLGVLDLARPVAGPFTPRQIKLIETFADQAVIAIENARLFDEVQQRTKELAASLDDLRTAQDRLVQTEKLASLGQLTAGIAHEIKNPLNFINNFSALSVELIDEMTGLFENPALDDADRRKELDEIRELLKSNLEKVVQHGKRADSIVKNMLLHSREGSGEQRAVDINALLDESLNLAYHGARAEKPGFNITLQRDLDPDAGVIELFPQEITRALLNMISNGFYAASERGAGNGDANFEPVLSAATKNLGSHIEIRIRDNGMGIPPEVKEKMFNPFFTTKPAGEGTGLGLSMSHDIIVKQHGGRIEVDTQPGQFTEFTIVLPRAANLGSTRKD